MAIARLDSQFVKKFDMILNSLHDV